MTLSLVPPTGAGDTRWLPPVLRLSLSCGLPLRAPSSMPGGTLPLPASGAVGLRGLCCRARLTVGPAASLPPKPSRPVRCPKVACSSLGRVPPKENTSETGREDGPMGPKPTCESSLGLQQERFHRCAFARRPLASRDGAGSRPLSEGLASATVVSAYPAPPAYSHADRLAGSGSRVGVPPRAWPGAGAAAPALAPTHERALYYQMSTPGRRGAKNGAAGVSSISRPCSRARFGVDLR